MRKMSSYNNTIAPSTDFPNGNFKNETQPNANDGTDIKKEHMQDLFYSLYQILQLYGEEPNENLEDGYLNKQFIKCLTNIGIFKYDSSILYKENALITNTNNNITKFYRSRINNNNFSLNDLNYWHNFMTINSDGSFNFEGLLNTDLSNINKQGIENLKAIVSSILIPNYNAGFTFPKGWKATENGIVYLRANASKETRMAYINGQEVGAIIPNNHTYGENGGSIYAIIKKGDTITYSGSFVYIRFYPYSGPDSSMESSFNSLWTSEPYPILNNQQLVIAHNLNLKNFNNIKYELCLKSIENDGNYLINDIINNIFGEVFINNDFTLKKIAINITNNTINVITPANIIAYNKNTNDLFKLNLNKWNYIIKIYY